MTKLYASLLESPLLTKEDGVKVRNWLNDRMIEIVNTGKEDFIVYTGELSLECLVDIMNANIVREIPMCVLSVNREIVEQETKLSFERKLQKMFPNWYDKSKDNLKMLQFIKIERDD